MIIRRYSTSKLATHGDDHYLLTISSPNCNAMLTNCNAILMQKTHDNSVNDDERRSSTSKVATHGDESQYPLTSSTLKLQCNAEALREGSEELKGQPEMSAVGLEA